MIRVMSELVCQNISTPSLADVNLKEDGEFWGIWKEFKNLKNHIYRLEWEYPTVDARKIFYFIEQFWTNEEW